MSESIEGYLSELKTVLSKGLKQDDVEKHLAEVRNHLDCAAAQTTDAEAIQEFGDAKSLAAKLILAHKPKRTWAFYGALAALEAPIILLLLGLLFLYDCSPNSVWVGMQIAVAAFIIFSVMTKRPLLKHVAVAGIVTLLAFPLLECCLFVTVFPKVGHGLIPRYRANEIVAEQQRRLDQLAPVLYETKAAEAAYERGNKEALAQLTGPSGYVVPTRITYSRPVNNRVDATLETVTVPTLAEAKARWSKNPSLVDEAQRDKNFGMSVVRSQTQFDDRLLAEYWVYLKDPQSLTALGLYFLIMSAVNFLCRNFTNWVQRLRRKRQIAT